MMERGRRLNRDDVNRLADFCEEREIKNIEDVLTAASIANFSGRNPTVLSLLEHLLYGQKRQSAEDRFYATRPGVTMRQPRREPDISSVHFLQDTLQVLFGLLANIMLPARPNAAHEAISSYIKERPSCIVTTNYDCCIDQAIGKPATDFSYCLDFGNADPVAATSKNRCNLIKLHGSLNWFYCDTCQEVNLIDIQQAVDHFLNDTAPFPVIGICRHCGGQRRGLLIPPSSLKFDISPPLTPLLNLAKSGFEKSDLIVVVGFSFAEADLYILRMLTKSMQSNSKQRMPIVDPSYEVVGRVKKPLSCWNSKF